MLPTIDALKAQRKGDRLMKKNSTVAIRQKQIFKEKKLTIGMDLGDRFTYYCILDEAGEVVVEQKLSTTKQAMKQVFGRIPRSRVAGRFPRKTTRHQRQLQNRLDTHRPSHGRTWPLVTSTLLGDC